MNDLSTRYARLAELLENEARALIEDERANLPEGATFWFAQSDTTFGMLRIIAYWKTDESSGHVERKQNGDVWHKVTS